jgi:dipeptidyl aminopeptidase/acylaminoacyl peptidase
VAVSPEHERIAQLRVTMERWTNRFGLYATGFVLWPRHYVAGQRYPAIVITHGSDADERFASPDMQWNYPAQLFAERGYVVLLMNDPATAQDARIDAAYDQWISGQGSMTPQEIQDLIWLNGVAAFETAVADLVDRGIVDATRVGIAGYSRGSQMTNVTMTQSRMFRAASSGDGGYLEPSAYRFISRSYDTVYGGDPFGPAIDNYRRLTPSLRASQASGPILIQMAGPWSGGLEFYQALRRSARPAELSFYPGETSASDETHIFHVPRNRLLAMRENLAWFDFWLRDRRDPEMPFPERFAMWEAMSFAAAPETAGSE